jgi:hypothetical protein
MRIDLDKAERLIKSIRATEADLNRLYKEWETLSAKPKEAKASPPVRKPDPMSATSRIKKAILESKNGEEFTLASFANIVSEKKARAILEKLVYQKRIQRIRTGVYGKLSTGIAEVA